MRFQAFAGSLFCDTQGELALISVFRCYNAIFKDFTRLFAPYGLTEPQFNILILLAQTEEGMLLSKIGEKLLVTRANVTGLVDRLERDGLIARNGLPQDRRVCVAKVTKKGLEVLRRVVPLLAQRINDATKALGEEEKKSLIESLRKIRYSINGIEE